MEYRRCVNIVFGRPDEKSDYRWFEMAFWSMDRNIRHRSEPFCMEYAWEIDEVLAPVMDVNNLAYPPKPVDGEDEDAFIEYWIDLFAQAMVGKLRRPDRMPMKR